MGTFVCTYAGQILNEDMANKVRMRDFISLSHRNDKNCPETELSTRKGNYFINKIYKRTGKVLKKTYVSCYNVAYILFVYFSLRNNGQFPNYPRTSPI